MGGLIGKLAALVVYLCVGTIMAQAICLSYAWSKGYVSKVKVLSMFAVASAPESAKTADGQKDEKEATSEQSSIEDIEDRRARHMRNLELREEALQASLERIRREQSNVIAEKNTYRRIREAFDAHLKNTKEGVVAKGRVEARTILENMKPKQAKEQIMQMLEAGEDTEVVAILSEMPVNKRAKICNEFSKSEDDNKKMAELLRLIRQGLPEVTQLDETQDELNSTK